MMDTGRKLGAPRLRGMVLQPALWVLLVGMAYTPGASPAACASNVTQLRMLFDDPGFPLAWQETTMTDGRPLLVTLDERAGSLFISFVKTGAGLMAEGPARICRSGDTLEARFVREGLRLGAAASWMLQAALRTGAAVRMQRMGPFELRIGTAGWSGQFVPGPSRVGLQLP